MRILFSQIKDEAHFIAATNKNPLFSVGINFVKKISLQNKINFTFINSCFVDRDVKLFQFKFVK